MPTFDTPDEARRYIRIKESEGFSCEQKFGAEGIDVFCRFAVERQAPVKRPTPPEVRIEERQETFNVPEKMQLPHELREYQKQAVTFALSHRHVIVELPTGRGKTSVALGVVNELAHQRPVKTLVIVPTNILLHQWIEDGFRAAGVSATGVSGEGKAWGQHTVTTYPSALRNLGIITQYDLVIFDEVHHLFSPEYRKILFALENKPYLVGLTATVREYGEAKDLQAEYFPDIFARTIEEFQSGKEKIPVSVRMIPVSFNEEEREDYDKYERTIRRANRTLGPVPEWRKYFNSYNVEYRDLARGAISAYSKQKRLLTETPDKLNAITRILHDNPGQFIVFSDTIDGIKSIEETLQGNGISEGSIYSGVKPAKRSGILEGLRDKSTRVLVGGSAITEGLDLPDISNAIFSSLLVKSSRTYVQRVGRILRPTPGKSVKLFLVYVQNTLEENNAEKVKDMLGDVKDGYFK